MSFYEETLEKAAKWASIEFERLITVKSLRTDSKVLSVSYPRFFAMAYMHETGRYSLPQIARALNLTNHTSVLHGLRRAHGHDGKKVAQRKEPLWTKELFQNAVRKDYPQVEVMSLDDIQDIGERNLRFVNGAGWAS